MTKYFSLTIATILSWSCSDRNHDNNRTTIQVDSVRLFVDSVIHGNAMAWDDFQLAAQAFDSINSNDKANRLYYFDAVVKISNRGISSGLDVLLAKELQKNTLRYIETRPEEFVEAITMYPKDSLIGLATGLGIEILEREKDNALTKSKQVADLIKNSFHQNDTLKNNRVTTFTFYVDTTIKAIQSTNR